MTRTDFVVALAATKGPLVWVLQGSVLRAFDSELGEYCPLTAVAEAPAMLEYAEHVGMDRLGLTAEDAIAILRAADGATQHDTKLRKALLKAVGLKDVLSL